MRVYLPSTLPALSRFLVSEELSNQPLHGFAVTPALCEAYSSGDMEELEYIALLHAARASLRLLQNDPMAPRRRVVLAAELPAEQIVAHSGFHEPALVEIQKPLLLTYVVSGHVDDPAAETEIAAAVTALPAADRGDDDAQFTVDSAEGHELLWYATQELQHVAG